MIDENLCLTNLKKPDQDTETFKITPKVQLSSVNNDCGVVTVGLDETLSEVEPPTLEMNTLSQSDVRDVEKDVSDPSVLMDSSICAATEGLEKEDFQILCLQKNVYVCQVTPEKDQLSLEDQDSDEREMVKISPVKEHVLNEEQSFCSSTEAAEECAPVSGTSPAIQSFMNGIESSHYSCSEDAHQEHLCSSRACLMTSSQHELRFKCFGIGKGVSP
ncbi:hypothetical protein G5714_002484 [Onychostoma macrolepis]|uniref:Uncharacterized protein n=1 Tax=Onychostoma macrolepis TaxID=369639 RepID=A0A7J6DFR5_9TELE|nr:hypothetical protein G5714_002484 [Onychostoma macrolepis]